MVQWYDMRDGLLIDVDNRLHNYATYARNLSWESRANVAVFRGNLRHTTTVKELPSNTFRLKLNSTTWLQYGRGKLVTLRQQANASQYLNINLGRGTQADVVKDNWNDILASLITDEPQQLSMFEQARLFKYTVYAEGNCGWADRLKWYLSLGLVPILQVIYSNCPLCISDAKSTTFGIGDAMQRVVHAHDETMGSLSPSGWSVQQSHCDH